MARLQDPVILAQYQSALANWRYTGYVEWKDIAQAWVRDNLPNWAPRAVAEEMYKFVHAGGEIDQVPERRPEWNDRDFHYDLRVPIAGRMLYIETVLVDDDPDDPTIFVVNIHDA
jgi:hypothetical protein